MDKARNVAGPRCSPFSAPQMNKLRNIALAGASILAASSAFAADPADYGATLTTNLTTINSIWGSVATIMIGVALVTVGVRFFRKTK